MKDKICQSCGMPIESNDQMGTNKDGSINNDYCKYCYKDGEFIDKVTMEEYINMCSLYGKQAGMTNDEMKQYCTKLFPTLKRWKTTNDMKNLKIGLFLIILGNLLYIVSLVFNNTSSSNFGDFTSGLLIGLSIGCNLIGIILTVIYMSKDNKLKK